MLWLAIIIAAIALCSAFYLSQTQRTTSNSPTTVAEIAAINNTVSASEELNKTNNTANQSIVTIPLEKPPFID